MVKVAVLILTTLFFEVLETVANRREIVTNVDEPEEEVTPYRINVVIVIMNENHPFHIKRAQKMKSDLTNQVKKAEVRKQCRVVLLHPDLHKTVPFGGWTILPLAKTLTDKFETANWFYFVNEFVSISVEKLVRELLKYDAPRKALFLGRAIRDSHPHVLHHYQYADGADGGSMDYPEFSAGYIMSRHLLSNLIENGDFSMHLPNPNNIDMNYEIAKLINEKFDYHVPLKNVPLLCGANWRGFTDPEKALQCISEMQWEEWMDSKSLPDNEICYAVKTYRNNHNTRLKVLRETWARPNDFGSPVKFYSNMADPEIGTVQVPVTIPNVERGHCEKSLYILRDFHDNDAKKCKWLVLVDDDTLVNTKRMTHVLHRYSSTTNVKYNNDVDEETGKPKDGNSKVDLEALAVGERWGFNHWPVIEDNVNKAYDFLAGGAGIALTRTAVARIIEDCHCSLRDPDDMMLGLCMTRIGIPMIHNPLFHQGTPLFYPWELIRFQKPVTFHSFQDIDGNAIYDNYLVPDLPKKHDPNQKYLHPYMEPPVVMTSTPPPGVFQTPKVDQEGNVIEALTTDRDATFTDEVVHEEL